MKDFDTWNQKKKQVQAREFTGYVHEREVWWSSVGVNIGVEIDGKHEEFERPVLVIRKFNRHAVLAVPITSKVKENPYLFTYEHKSERFALVLSQVRLISTKRLLRKIFTMNERAFGAAILALTEVINERPSLSRGPRRT